MQDGARRVMRSERARRDRRLPRRRFGEGDAERRLDLLARDRARPQQARRAAETGDNRGFDAPAAGAGVENQGDAPVEVGQHVLGARRADGAGAVGGGRGERPADSGDERARDLKTRHANGERVEAGAREQADAAIRGDRRDQRQRPRPETLGEPERDGVEPRLARSGLHAFEMRDQRVERRAALDGVNLGDRRVRGRQTRQAIDGLGRNADEAAGAQDPRRLPHAVCVSGYNAGSARFGAPVR